ncbi:MAG: hypothetical protein ACREVB_15130, partial [Burkholderiales bacterium]
MADATFHALLLAYDRDLADTARCAGCARCSGVVHSAPYWRKPRGRPCRLGCEHDRRFSFCCAVDGCRSRATPPSLRFLGPKVYIAAIVVLIAILRHGVTARRMRELTEVIGVDRRTAERSGSTRPDLGADNAPCEASLAVPDEHRLVRVTGPEAVDPKPDRAFDVAAGREDETALAEVGVQPWRCGQQALVGVNESPTCRADSVSG